MLRKASHVDLMAMKKELDNMKRQIFHCPTKEETDQAFKDIRKSLDTKTFDINFELNKKLDE
jgi:uncharacterized FlaG/YvyC family protein